MRILKRSRPTIGVLAGWQTYPGTIHSFLDHVYRGIQAAAVDYDCNIMFGCGVASPLINENRQAMPIEMKGTTFIPVGPWNTDGLIVIGPLFNDPAERYFEALKDSGFPILYAGNRDTGPAVVVDNKGGIIQAIDHLVMHGHRQIAFIAGFEDMPGDTAIRHQGYRAGLEKHGLPYDTNLIAHGRNAIETGYLAMRQILSRGTPFTAVVANNDEAAVGAMDALRDAGLLVPRDVAVIGFDDRLESRAQTPLLTTVHFPMFEMGYHSLELLTQMIEGIAPPVLLRSIPTHLVIRESCGCLPGVGPFINMNTASAPEQAALPSPARSMASVVYKEMQRLNRREVEYLCQRLLDAYQQSLALRDASTFRMVTQQILEHVTSLDDDLYSWQAAITVLKEWTPAMLSQTPGGMLPQQAEDLLHQARVTISEMMRGRHSRNVVRAVNISSQLSQMSSQLFAAKDETEIFQVFAGFLPVLRIQHAAILYYRPEADDPFAQSELRMPALPAADPAQPLPPTSFPTRSFPPPGLYPEENPFSLAILPLHGSPDAPLGYAAFQTTSLDPLGWIVSQLEASLRNARLYQQALEAQRQAEEANYLKSRFLSIVSHELRTPLNLISGLSNMMLDSSQTLNDLECLVNRKDLARIFISAQHLESLIRDVLDLARSDVGQLKLACEPLDLHEVLDAVSVIGEQLALDKELTWRTDIPEHLPFVRADRARLRQVVLNLVNNAVKFTPRGGVTLSASSQDGYVTISVQDTGLGIPPEEQAEIFNEYTQSRRTAARGYGGLGLGLAICRRLIEMHNGQIGVTSSGEEGSGSTFFFRLPAIQTGKNDTAPVPPGSQRVLLLTRESTSSRRLVDYLARQNIQVELHQVDGADDWLAWLQPEPPEKVMLDLNLTSERGWDILKAIKENPATRDVPVLFVNLDAEGESGALLDLNYLTKPVDRASLANEMMLRDLPLQVESSTGSRPILIVDDDPEILELHARLLDTIAGGYTILRAHNGREALDIIHAERPALVLLDLMMPEVDGFDVLEAMQAEDLLRSIPVIVLTSQVLTEEDMARLNNRAASVLGKGIFTAQETLDHVTAALQRRRRPASETRRMVLKAMAFINSNYKMPISRCDIAASVGVSERHLSRCFQQEVGITPITYLNRLRIQVAKSLLDTSGMSITDVALEVGFSSGGYFTRVFREEEGLSPRDYQRNRGGG